MSAHRKLKIASVKNAASHRPIVRGHESVIAACDGSFACASNHAFGGTVLHSCQRTSAGSPSATRFHAIAVDPSSLFTSTFAYETSSRCTYTRPRPCPVMPRTTSSAANTTPIMIHVRRCRLMRAPLGDP